jgi:hypothetical protein
VCVVECEKGKSTTGTVPNKDTKQSTCRRSVLQQANRLVHVFPGKYKCVGSVTVVAARSGLACEILSNKQRLRWRLERMLCYKPDAHAVVVRDASTCHFDSVLFKADGNLCHSCDCGSVFLWLHDTQYGPTCHLLSLQYHQGGSLRNDVALAPGKLTAKWAWTATRFIKHGRDVRHS